MRSLWYQTSAACFAARTLLGVGGVSWKQMFTELPKAGDTEKYRCHQRFSHAFIGAGLKTSTEPLSSVGGDA